MKSTPKLLARQDEFRVVPQSEWTDKDRMVWEGFPEYIQNVLMGNHWPPQPFAIGRKGEEVVLFTQRFNCDAYDDSDDWSGEPCRSFRLTTTIFVMCIDGNSFFDDPDSSEWQQVLFPDDGEHDFLGSKVPDHLRWYVEAILEDLKNDDDDEVKANWIDYIEQECGGIAKIADTKIRRLFRDALTNG